MNKTRLSENVPTQAKTAATAKLVSAAPLSTPAPVASAQTNDACEEGNPPDWIAKAAFHFFVPT
jgi:hypothetical protein